ncbi:NUDIX hydrolase [Paenibacillus sp. UNC451MF]|uniref:NUDIX hydrolase n=1 Tax=Paenibacillus sp. UNC451MF TaxID=1449063 RepID=UPI00069182B8|nr:NUDIX hydrolase [Paenibacillus sp. UNC451MF]
MFFVNARAIVEREREGKTEIIIQTRNKPNEPKQLELPGGRVEQFESLLTALRREVKEETGLNVTSIEGEDTRIDTNWINPNIVVECVRPFTAYQTIKGGIDSVGYYFICRVEGELLKEGDQTKNPRWVSVDEVVERMHNDPL